MSVHAFFSPSKAPMWMQCFGALAQPENQKEGGSSTFADDGSVSHLLLDWTLKDPSRECAAEIGIEYSIEGRYKATIDEARAERIQGVVDDVRRRAMGGVLWSEYRVDLSGDLGPEQGGTSDVVILQPVLEEITILDLKDGSGEKVFAKYGDESLPPHKRINKQLGLYLKGVWKDAEMFGKFTKGRVVINQPKLNHIDEFEISYEELMLFGEMAAQAVAENGHALALAPKSPDMLLYLNPSEKACRWCRAKATCPKLATFVAEAVRADFETIVDEPPVAPTDDHDLSIASIAVPLIQLWVKAVNTEVWNRTQSGKGVVGPDGKPYKFVAGRNGKRAWEDEKVAEAALIGVLPEEKAYKPREIITAPAAAAILDKKKTKETWKDVFEPLIAYGKPAISLALGSDPRPAYTGAATADEFADDIEV